MVSTHVDRNRVSNENRPVGVVGEYSMSPRSSLTTNVFPSRMRFIRVPPVGSAALPAYRSSRAPGLARWLTCREQALEADQDRGVAVDPEQPAQCRGQGVDVAVGDLVEVRAPGGDHRVGGLVG